MKPERQSRVVFGVTQSKAKMYEYRVPESYHIRVARNPASLLSLTVGILGDISAQINTGLLGEERVAEHRDNLRFAAQYFDAFRKSRLDGALGPYLSLLGAASYYLCDLPGSSAVMSIELSGEDLDLTGRGLEGLLLWLLKNEFGVPLVETGGEYSPAIHALAAAMSQFRREGTMEHELWSQVTSLRRYVYAFGAPRELLLTDTIGAVIRRRLDYSSWKCIPQFTRLPLESWRAVLQKPHFIKELWPAQRLLGEHGVFSGASAVIQMPTSAGKTRAIEIIIRSAVLSGRASIVVIVAPFRALCHEIRESMAKAFADDDIVVAELSDVAQADYDDEFPAQRAIVVVTPEKLLYVLRHEPDLATSVKLLIYDEGHQFDTGTRGVTYELLLTSLKRILPQGVQTILISAVMPNAEAIGAWLMSGASNVITGTTLAPTDRSVAFASWVDTLGQLKFVEQDRPDQDRFSVPRVLESLKLATSGQSDLHFPDREDHNEIALFLALKLVPNGSVAVFCGKKTSAAGMCDRIVNAYSRNLPMDPPNTFSDILETARLSRLYEDNLGAVATATTSARLGVLSHHGNTPHGIRLAVEHAMKEGLAKFVVCTSTLAQGVNLPIRYLIVADVQQGRALIKTRDFHNLIGRAGRSGMHTEGSIIFADRHWYDDRYTASGRWRWEQVTELLQMAKSEPCGSSLLSLMDPLKSDSGRAKMAIDPLVIVNGYVGRTGYNRAWADGVAKQLRRRKGYDKIEDQILGRARILEAIESYLMANWDALGTDSAEAVAELARETLAYHLATGEQKILLLKVFATLANNVFTRVPDSSRRSLFGGILCGASDAVALAEWVKANIANLVATDSDDSLLDVVWPALMMSVQESKLSKCDPPGTAKVLANGWLQGLSFGTLAEKFNSSDAKLRAGTRKYRVRIEQIVEMTEGELAFDGALVVGAIAEIVGALHAEDGLKVRLEGLQKRVKYGLPSSVAVALYEAGFADRVIAQSLASFVDGALTRSQIALALREHRDEVTSAILQYPAYFHEVLGRILR